MGLTVLVMSAKHGRYSCADRPRGYSCVRTIRLCSGYRRLNVLADILWRPTQMSGTEWSLSTPICLPSTDMGKGNPFTGSVYNKVRSQLPLFVSLIPDPSAMGVDALSMSWKTLWAYPALLPWMLEKAQRNQCELSVIATHWPRATWLILPVVICLSQRLSYPCLSTYLYTQLRGLIRRNLSNLQLHPWRDPGCSLHQRLFGQRCLLCQ